MRPARHASAVGAGEGVAQSVLIPTDAADVRGEGAARIRRMSANGQSVASGQKRCRSGKRAQVGRASTAYVMRSRGKNLPANAKLDG